MRADWVYPVAGYFGLEVADIRVRSRNKIVTEARRTAMVLMTLDGMRQVEVASVLGLNDPSSIAHGLRAARKSGEPFENAEVILEEEYHTLLDKLEGLRNGS